jgi:hypothetical protein
MPPVRRQFRPGSRVIGERVSHYRLESMLGSGTYGAVFKGTHVADTELGGALESHPWGSFAL